MTVLKNLAEIHTSQIKEKKMEIDSVLVEYNNGQNSLTCSGIIFEKRWVLFPATVCISTLKEIPDYVRDMQIGSLCQKNFFRINQNNLKICLEAEPRKLIWFKGHFAACFSCKNILSSTNFTISNEHCDNIKANLLSYFIIADICMVNSKVNTILPVLYQILKNCISITRGASVFANSCPFGTPDLIGSKSFGIISNCFGKNACYFLTDASTAPGSEGGAIFMLRKQKSKISSFLCGIVISSLSTWRGEETGFTLGVSIVPLLSQLIPNHSTINILQSSLNQTSVLNINNLIDLSIAQIFCGSNWGTAILLEKKNSIFITAAHVLRKNSNSLTLKWKNISSPATVLFRASAKSAFDLAVIQGTSRMTKNMTALKLASSPPVKGERVLSVGFPIFTSDTQSPTITIGNISLSTPMVLHTTCTVLHGMSGGAILKLNGELFGIIVCHTVLPYKDQSIVFPKINMSVPITAISQHLNEYFKTKDIATLKKLECRDLDAINHWRFIRSKL